jgi:hypothetical protein
MPRHQKQKIDVTIATNRFSGVSRDLFRVSMVTIDELL